MRLVAVAAAACIAVAACSGSPAAPRTPAAQHGHPNLAAFLALPVATPSSCPASVNGATVGRRSPWVGTVDVSVFLKPGDAGAVAARLRPALTALPGVAAVYFESQTEAYAEFQRLYTCSAAVSPSSVPASFRLVLTTMPLQQRDALVQRILGLKGVATVSCDPSSPCVDVVATPTAT